MVRYPAPGKRHSSGSLALGGNPPWRLPITPQLSSRDKCPVSSIVWHCSIPRFDKNGLSLLWLISNAALHRAKRVLNLDLHAVQGLGLAHKPTLRSQHRAASRLRERRPRTPAQLSSISLAIRIPFPIPSIRISFSFPFLSDNQFHISWSKDRRQTLQTALPLVVVAVKLRVRAVASASQATQI